MLKIKKVGLRVAAPTGNTFVGARCSMGVAVSVLLTSPVVSALSLPRRNLIRSFPIRAEFPLGRVPSGAHDLSKNKVSNLEVSVTDPRVIVLGHADLVLSEPLLCCRPELVHQIQL